MKIVLLEPLRVPDETIAELSLALKDKGYDFESYSERTTDPKELAERTKDADIVIIANTPYPKESFENADQLKLINVAFTGTDHVDVKFATENNIKVANASGYATQAVAELTIGLTMGVYRSLAQGNEDVRLAEDFPGLIQGQEIHGKTVGILGMGDIGLATAKLFIAFGAKVIAYNRSESQEVKDLGIEYKSLDEVLSESDIVSVHLPLTDSTKHLLDAEKLALMKESAILINVARGPIIDNQALADALNNDNIAGAGIDVFDTEPPLPSNDPLLNAKNALLSPHIGYLTDEAMVKRAKIVFDNVLAFLDGEPKNLVN